MPPAVTRRSKQQTGRIYPHIETLPDELWLKPVGTADLSQVIRIK